MIKTIREAARRLDEHVNDWKNPTYLPNTRSTKSPEFWDKVIPITQQSKAKSSFHLGDEVERKLGEKKW